jgi:hypothetical protein
MNRDNYLQMYLPCFAVDTISGGQVVLQGISHSEGMCQFETEGNEDWGNTEYFKPILRRLSDITHEEICDIFNEKFAVPFTKVIRGEVSQSTAYFYWYMEKYSDEESLIKVFKYGFDIFGLIDAELAVDRTTLNFITQ